jgi:hypothetical protein
VGGAIMILHLHEDETDLVLPGYQNDGTEGALSLWLGMHRNKINAGGGRSKAGLQLLVPVI